jgi:hypothetical protein
MKRPKRQNIQPSRAENDLLIPNEDESKDMS